MINYPQSRIFALLKNMLGRAKLSIDLTQDEANELRALIAQAETPIPTAVSTTVGTALTPATEIPTIDLRPAEFPTAWAKYVQSRLA